MGLYDAMKDAVSLAQKADNIELYRQLLDLSAQALDLQAEVARLREENAELKKQHVLEDDIEYNVDAFVTRKSDAKPIKYCAACWVDKGKLIPLQDVKWDNYDCPLCKAHVVDMSNWKERQEKYSDEQY